MARPVRPEVPLGEVEPRFEEQLGDDEGILDGLAEREVEVLRLRFGLGAEQPCAMPREAVARRLSLSVSQVRTIEAKAMRQLRQGLAKVVDRAPLQGGADPP
jgi:DNA-directed RNA polymerase sigma subunit (sigma70/sigma32)